MLFPKPEFKLSLFAALQNKMQMIPLQFQTSLHTLPSLYGQMATSIGR